MTIVGWAWPAGVAMRRGYTLFEMILVVTVMLIVAGMATPLVFHGMFSSTKVSAAADMVRARWADCRHQACEHNRPYRFAVVPNTGKFKIEPYDPAIHDPVPGSNSGQNGPSGTSGTTTVAPDGSPTGPNGTVTNPSAQNTITPFVDSNTPVYDGTAKMGIVIEDRLPTGVRFGTKDVPASSDGDEADSGDYVTIAVFMPDGTAQDDVEIVFAAKGASSITLRLRGLTGTSTQTRAEEAK
jgi:prepilin-type N-terminal cleavage/methylation domain-containing protein